MEKKIKFASLLVLVQFVIQSIAFSHQLLVKSFENREYVSYHELVHQFALKKSFDIVSQKGKIYYKNHVAVFNVDFSVFLIDGMLHRSRYPVKRHNGEVLIPRDAVESMIDRFFGHPEITLKGNILSILTKALEDKALPDRGKEIKKNGQGDKIVFIVIDPGHGGKDPGAIGKRGIQEKRITLNIARFLESKLRDKLKNILIRSTRSDDRFIPLIKRTEMANRNLKKGENGILLSIHVNASLSGMISGYETYFLSQNPTNEEARNTAALENNVVVLENRSGADTGYGDIDYIEAMMMTTQILKESSLLAESVQQGLNGSITSFKSRGVKKADFFVLRGVLLPAVLVEVGYITNSQELKYLNKKSYQMEIADGIAKGVINFIDRYNKLMIRE